MPEMTKKLVLPKLRFIEFKDEWELKFGNEVFQSISNKKHNSDLPILAISQKFGALPRHMIDYKISVTSNSIASYKVVEVGDFIISLRSFQGGIEYSKYKGICSPAYNILRPSISIDDDFYKFYLKTFKYIQNLQRKLEGIRDGKMISYKYFSEIKIPYPSLPEQQKIASFLRAVDKKLQQLTKKKELLETYKKGVMQKIFSQELRFKDEFGNNYPDWEEKKLGEIGDLINGLTYSPKDITADGVLVLRSSNVQNNQLAFEDNVYVNVESFNPVKENDILICVRNGSKRLIGKNCLIDKNNEGVAFGAFMTVYRSINNKFIFQLFSHSSYYKKIHRNLGATINSINNNDLKKFKFSFPSVPEQQKIAKFLSSLDSKIDLVRTQIENTKAFKKGLLQQMYV